MPHIFAPPVSPFFGHQKAMGRKKDISPEEKAKVIAWLQEGMKTTEVAACLSHAPSAIRKHIAVLKTLPLTAPPPPAKKRTDRKRKVTTNMKVRMGLFVKRNPFKTARELRNEVFGWSKISVRSIQEILKNELGLPSRVATKKPMLTKKMVKKRLAFCKKFKHWREKD